MKSFGDNDKNATVRRSHLTTHLVLLPEYTTRDRKLPCFSKSSEDNDKNATVRRSHLTTRLVPQNDRLSLSFIVGTFNPQKEACFLMR